MINRIVSKTSLNSQDSPRILQPKRYDWSPVSRNLKNSIGDSESAQNLLIKNSAQGILKQIETD
jgi:hypothetical protein